MVICPYCAKPTRLTNGFEVYKNNPIFHNMRLWVCDPCDARVACHKNTNTPKGTLANADLRKKRVEAHKYFDPIWKNGNKSRPKAYSWLAKKLKISPKKCHIGSFNIEQCNQVIRVCKNG